MRGGRTLDFLDYVGSALLFLDAFCLLAAGRRWIARRWSSAVLLTLLSVSLTILLVPAAWIISWLLVALWRSLGL
jgi:hypothetical protein